MTAVRSTRAFALTKLGYDGLVEIERPVPPVGQGQVLIRMRAASLNFRDLKILKGVYYTRPELPVTPLSDGAGEIVEVGPQVLGYAPGDRVMPAYWEGWRTGPMSEMPPNTRQRADTVDGVAIECGVYEAADIVPIPDSLSFEEAACLPCAAVTAWHGLVCAGGLKAGDSVLVMGSGGVSIFGLQIARMHGARVIATSSDPAKLRRMVDMGATAGPDYRRTPRWGEAVRELTGGRGVDHVLEVGGAGALEQSIRATADGGKIALVGDLTGGFATPRSAERDIRMNPIAVGSRQMTEDVARAFDGHGVRPVIDRVFPFPELKAALRRLEAGRHFGKVVISF